MIALLSAAATALIISLFGTPLLIRYLVRQQYGQFIRQDGPTAHMVKRGTPTMGGLVIIVATVAGVFAASIQRGTVPSATIWLTLYLMCGLGFIGFLDDFTKIRNQRSLGLSPVGKIIGQAVVGISFAILAVQFPNANGRTPASFRISVLRDTNLNLRTWGLAIGLVLFVIWANFLITAWSNAVNLTDGLDGLATGSSLVVFLIYLLVGLWQSNQSCQILRSVGPGCYETRDPRDIAIVAVAIVGACFGFLWWNAAPAKIFMGDTGSLALGGALAALSIMSRTQVLAVVIGGLFVVIVMSDVIQIVFFKATRRRVFKMAPLHHHFELSGWAEITIVIRFWLIAGLFAAVGMGIFYAEWVIT